eukprot:4955757-Prymnesium_polylepis.1
MHHPHSLPRLSRLIRAAHPVDAAHSQHILRRHAHILLHVLEALDRNCAGVDRVAEAVVARRRL